jgi:ubiquinone/menaquinone biosynthesis C-methylase UbiE
MINMETSILMKKEVPLWQYDEFKHPGEDFDVEAEFYDERFQTVIDTQGEIKRILELLNLQPDQTVLEIGAGTGNLTVAVAEHCSKVLAVDLSQSMLRLAEIKARSRGLKNIEFIQGGFLTYEHNREPVDVVVSQRSLHYLPDFWKQIALSRLSKTMKPGGKLLLHDSVYSFDIKNYQEYFNGIISYLTGIARKDTVDNITTHIREEYTTNDWIMEGLIRKAGFKIDIAEYENLSSFAIYLCTKTA